MADVDGTHDFVFGSNGYSSSLCKMCGLPEGHRVHNDAYDIMQNENMSPNLTETYEQRIAREEAEKAEKASKNAFIFSLFSVALSGAAVLYNVFRHIYGG